MIDMEETHPNFGLESDDKITSEASCMILRMVHRDDLFGKQPR